MGLCVVGVVHGSHGNGPRPCSEGSLGNEGHPPSGGKHVAVVAADGAVRGHEALIVLGVNYVYDVGGSYAGSQG